MAHPNKVRGNRFEYELRDDMINAGIPVDRARGSDGRAIGEHQTVDLRAMRQWRVQAKRVKKLAEKYKLNEHQDVVVMRADREEAYALVRWKWVMAQWMEILKLRKEIRNLKAKLKKNQTGT